MSLLITCWNVQKLNVQKADDFGYNIAQGLLEARARWSAPNFIAFLLENRVDPDQVGDLLIRHLGGGYSHRSFDIGGGAHTRENIIVVHSTSVHIASHEIVQPDFAALRTEDDAHAAAASALGAGFDLYSLRRPKQVHVNPQVEHADEWYRGVLVLTLTAGGKTYRVAALHLPGPREMKLDLWHRGYAPQLAPKADLIVGDFNLREALDGDGWKDVSADLVAHGTTFDEASLDFGTSKWDKVLCRAQSALGLVNLKHLAPIVPECRAITDHCGLAVLIPDAEQPTARVFGAAVAVAFAGVAVYLLRDYFRSLLPF